MCLHDFVLRKINKRENSKWKGSYRYIWQFPFYFPNQTKFLPSVCRVLDGLLFHFWILDFINPASRILKLYPLSCCTCISIFAQLYTAKTVYRKFKTNIPRNETARPQFQYLHSCFCERFIYSHDRSAYCYRKIGGPIVGIYKCSQIHECGIWDCAVSFLGVHKSDFRRSVHEQDSLSWLYLVEEVGVCRLHTVLHHLLAYLFCQQIILSRKKSQ